VCGEPVEAELEVGELPGRVPQQAEAAAGFEWRRRPPRIDQSRP
jgi:hypothetical protein